MQGIPASCWGRFRCGNLRQAWITTAKIILFILVGLSIGVHDAFYFPSFALRPVRAAFFQRRRTLRLHRKKDASLPAIANVKQLTFPVRNPTFRWAAGKLATHG